MNRFRLLALGTLLFVATGAGAQQTAVGHGSTGKEDHSQSDAKDDVPKVEMQLKTSTAKLGLTNDQQIRIRPILQELHEATLRVLQDKTLSHEERLGKVRPQRYKADKQIRMTLNDDQKKKLDQYEGPHSEKHGSISGTTSPPPRRREQIAEKMPSLPLCPTVAAILK